MNIEPNKKELEFFEAYLTAINFNHTDKTMSIFSPENLKATMTELYARQQVLSKIYAAYDGSKGDDQPSIKPVRDEINMIAATTRQFYEDYGLMPADYYGLKSQEYLESLSTSG